MRQSTSARRRRSWAAPAAIALAVLVLAVGFCVFDRNNHDGMDDHASLDLCLGMLTVSLPIVLTLGLPLTGLTTAFQLAPVPSFAPRIPAPPPKLLS